MVLEINAAAILFPVTVASGFLAFRPAVLRRLLILPFRLDPVLFPG